MKIKAVLFAVVFLTTTLLFGQKITKKEGIYVNENGKKYSGIYVSYYQDDVKEVVYTIKNGVEDGSVEFYYPTTEIMEQGNFKGGMKHGKWVRWSEKGDKLAEAWEIFDSGDLLQQMQA